MLYQLTLTDPALSYDGYSEDFLVGFFATGEEAAVTARRYLYTVPGFCDHLCTYRITPKAVRVPASDSIPAQIWVIQGWNYNQHADEVDLVESDCFPTEAAATAELTVLRVHHRRDEWVVTTWVVGHCAWGEGFRRESHSQ